MTDLHKTSEPLRGGSKASNLSRRAFLALGSALAAAHWASSASPCAATPIWADHLTHGPFQCHATFPLTGLTGLFEDLSGVELELQRTLAIPPARQSIDVFLLDDERAHRELLSQLYPRVPYRRAC